MVPINPNDPISTAAAALALAGALRPDLDAAVRDRATQGTAADLDDLAQRMKGARLFESQNAAFLRELLADAEAGVCSETAEILTWASVRYIDGVEEVEPVTVIRRTLRGDALAERAGRLRELVGLIERTQTLLDAQLALASLRRRHLLRAEEE